MWQESGRLVARAGVYRLVFYECFVGFGQNSSAFAADGWGRFFDSAYRFCSPFFFN